MGLFKRKISKEDQSRADQLFMLRAMFMVGLSACEDKLRFMGQLPPLPADTPELQQKKPEVLLDNMSREDLIKILKG